MVYLAHDHSLDRDVAIATFRVEGLDEAGRARVAREARAMGRLGDHPHIVTVFDIGEEKGRPYIVSQYMAGGTLDDLLRRSPSHRLPVEDALRIAEQVCQAIQYAHTAGIVHRDIKPANVFLTQDGKAAKLGDFGLAIAPDQSRLTIKGMMVGTAAYMPPEQALGRQLEPRSDLYSLGAMLYELLTGRTPFLADDLIGMISQHLNARPERPSTFVGDITDVADGLVLKLLAKSPSERPSSAAAVLEDLQALGERKPPSLHLPSSSAIAAEPDPSPKPQTRADEAPRMQASSGAAPPSAGTQFGNAAKEADHPSEEAEHPDESAAPQVESSRPATEPPPPPLKAESLLAPLGDAKPGSEKGSPASVTPLAPRPLVTELEQESAPQGVEIPSLPAEPGSAKIDLSKRPNIVADTSIGRKADTSEFEGPDHTGKFPSEWLTGVAVPIGTATIAAIGLVAVVFGIARYGYGVLGTRGTSSVSSSPPATTPMPLASTGAQPSAAALAATKLRPRKLESKPSAERGVHELVQHAKASPRQAPTPAPVARADLHPKKAEKLLGAPSMSAGLLHSESAISKATARPSVAPARSAAETPSAAVESSPTAQNQIASAEGETNPTVRPESLPSLTGMSALKRINYYRRMSGLPEVSDDHLRAEVADELWNRQFAASQAASIPLTSFSMMGFRVVSRETLGVVAMEIPRTDIIATNTDSGFSGGDIIEGLIRMPLASLTVLDPQLRSAGFAIHCESGVCAAVLSAKRGLEKDAFLSLFQATDRVRFWNPQLGALPPLPSRLIQPIEFPPPSRSIDLLSDPGGDVPGVAAMCADYSSPTGIPISLQLGVDVSNPAPPVVAAHSLDRDGVPIEHCLVQASSFDNQTRKESHDAEGILRSWGAVMLIPREPLQPGSRYTVSITADSTEYSWLFKTGAAR